MRNPFSDSNTTICYSSMFADENAFYRCEQIYSSTLNGRTIYIEQIVRTDLSDFSETIIYEDKFIEDTAGAFLGLGEYLPFEIPEECSIRSFTVIKNNIYMEMTDGIYSCRIGAKKITDDAVLAGEWAYMNGQIYYADELYRLHCLDISSSTDAIITDVRISGFFLTESSIYLRSLSDGGAMLKMDIEDDTSEMIVSKTGNCFAVDDEYIYYTDSANGGLLCKIEISSGKTEVVSNSECSFVYPISGCDYFYYRAFDVESGDNLLIKENKDNSPILTKAMRRVQNAAALSNPQSSIRNGEITTEPKGVYAHWNDFQRILNN